MAHLGEAIIIVAILFTIIIMQGDPDILDGWIKAANRE